MNEKQMTAREWSKTPYAKSHAHDPEGAITKLLEKYGVTEVMTAMYIGENKRPGYGIRFKLNDKCYRVGLEVMNADVAEDKLKLQIRRVIYYFLKSSLELTNVFMPVEQVLFAFIEIPTAKDATLFELAKGKLKELTAPGFSALMLPQKK